MSKEELNRDGIDIGNFEFVNHHVSLGEHMGNRFKVVLRDVKPKHVVDDFVDVVTSSLESVKERGVYKLFWSATIWWDHDHTPNRTGHATQGHSNCISDANMLAVHVFLLLQRKAVNIALMECSKISSETKELIR